jgi:hypothetical protein
MVAECKFGMSEFLQQWSFLISQVLILVGLFAMAFYADRQKDTRAGRQSGHPGAAGTASVEQDQAEPPAEDHQAGRPRLLH